MAKAKRKSKVYELAQKRLAGIESISPALDLGNGLTVTAFHTHLQAVADKLDAYNTLLSTADAAQNELADQEKVLREFSERMREAVGAVYGHNSNEYEKAGGKRKSERKRPTRKPKAA
jgi:hypothetical protein